MKYHGTSKALFVSNKIELGIVMLRIESQTNLVSHDKGNGIQRVRFNRFIFGMHRGHYGHPGPSDDH